MLAVLLFSVSILLHEFAHALAARKRNVEISKIILSIFGSLAKMKKEPEHPGPSSDRMEGQVRQRARQMSRVTRIVNR